MPKTLNLTNMSAKYLVDFLTTQGWAKDLSDIYVGGELLAEVLPRFIDPVAAEAASAPAVLPSEAELERLKAFPAHVDIVVPASPVPRAQQPNGNPDWARMTAAEADDFRAKSISYGRTFVAWCRVAVPPITLTDPQLATCQAMVKYFGPRSEEERAKDKEKGLAPRTEIPTNEFSFRLLTELQLAGVKK